MILGQPWVSILSNLVSYAKRKWSHSEFTQRELEQIRTLEKYYDIVGDGVAILKLEEALACPKWRGAVKKLADANLHLNAQSKERPVKQTTSWEDLKKTLDPAVVEAAEKEFQRQYAEKNCVKVTFAGIGEVVIDEPVTPYISLHVLPVSQWKVAGKLKESTTHFEYCNQTVASQLF